jgi:hypothetical protein
MARNTLNQRRNPGGQAVVIDDSHRTGNYFFVDSGATAATDTAGAGETPDAPFATIDFAIGRCTANNGDVIVVMPGHAETVAAASGIDIDVAGVTIIGQGDGSDRPTITSSAVGSTVVVDAANATIENILFTPSAASTIILDVNAADCTVRNCEFRMGTAVTAIDVNGGSANACDRLRVLDCTFDASTDGPDTAIGLDEVQDSVTIDGCYAYGLFDDAAIHNPTGKVLTWLRITNNILINTTASSHSIELVSACTGVIANNTCGSPLADATPGDIDGGACHILENYSHDAGGNDSGLLNPSADS